MKNESVAPLGRTLLVGCGYRGLQDLALLVGKDIRCDPETITVVDRNPHHLAWCSKNHPRVRVTESLDVALADRPAVVVITTPTLEHFGVFRRALACRVPALFVEKPLVSLKDLDPLSAIVGDARIGVGYPVNFSGVLGSLFGFMREQALVAREIRTLWAEDLLTDPFSSLGDLEDQATPPLCLALSIIALNQEIRHLSVRAALSDLPVVGRKPPRRPPQEDAPTVKTSTTTSQVALDITTDRFGELLVVSQSSSIASAPEHWVEVNLADAQGNLQYIARIQFDHKGEDCLWLHTANDLTLKHRWLSQSCEELAEQLRAFLAYAAGGERDPRLVTYELGARMVEIVRQALESDRVGCRLRV